MAAGNPVSISGCRCTPDTEKEPLFLFLRHWAVTDDGSVANPPDRERRILEIARGRSQPEGSCLDLEIRIQVAVVGGRCWCTVLVGRMAVEVVLGGSSFCVS